MAQITIEQAMQVALAHHQANRLAEAEAIYREVLSQVPDHGGALHLLGVLAGQVGRPAAAIELIARAIAVNPVVPNYHSNLGEFHRRMGQVDQAIACFHHALALDPFHADAHGNLGLALHEKNRLDEAVAAYTRALALDPPEPAEVYLNLGNALRDLGLFDDAIAALERALALRPDDARAHSNLATTLWALGRLDETVSACYRALAFQPDLAEAHNNLGIALRDQGRLDEALACFRRAVALKPDFIGAASNVLYTLQFHPGYDSREILAEHRTWARRFAEPLAGEILPHANDRTPDRKLRIGFLSPDLRFHPVGRSLLPLFAHRDRRQMEYVCYSDVLVADEVTRRLEGVADRWRENVGLSDQEVADRIRADQVDILVDTTLHTARSRLLVFARKPAPVQVTMLGPPTTTGLGTIDYRLTDPYLDPPGITDGDYTERSTRLPHCFWSYQEPEGTPPVGELPALKNGFVTFGCLNQFSKVTRPALELWSRVLQGVPGSRLVIQCQAGSHREAVYTLFEAVGIARDRIELAASAPRLEYFHRFHALDLGLDPFPYNGHTSTLDSLWMGVPVITLAGRTAVGRGGTSILSNVGLHQLIARTPDQYVDIALDSARDPARLASLRSNLRPRLQSSPLMHGKQYAADVEATFRHMWRTWCGT
jgi:predicted O-linked N-acetylglucosamine transferase (SPINDLY family)